MDVLSTLERLGTVSYWIAFAIAFLESLPIVGFLVPGTVAMILFGVVAATGAFDLGDCIAFASIGAIGGDLLAYQWGAAAPTHGRLYALVPKRLAARAEAFVAQHGGKAVFLSRFIGPIRPVVPYLVGATGMRRWRFVAWDVAGGVAWVTTYLLLGYFFGHVWQLVVQWSSRVGLLLLGFVTATVALLVVRRAVIRYGQSTLRVFASIVRSVVVALRANTEVQRLANAHPQLSEWIRRRLDRGSFRGLPLSVLSIVAVYLLVTFVGLVVDVHATHRIAVADVRIEHLLYSFRSPGVTEAFLWLTNFGNWQIIAVWAILLALALWRANASRTLAAFTVTLGGTALATFIGKLLIHRPRPPDIGVYLERSFSFPSGHAATATAFYGFLVVLAWRHTRKRVTRVNTLLAVIVLVVVVGLSRLYLGVHYLSDVIGGICLGTFWLIVGAILSEWRVPRTKTLTRRAVQRIGTPTFAVLFLVASLWSIAYAVVTHPAPMHRRDSVRVVTTEDPVSWFTNGRLPNSTENIVGTVSEPLSILVIAPSDAVLVDAFQRAGWYRAEPVTLASLARVATAALRNREYPTAPMTPAFWNMRVHDFGFELPTETQSVRERHHARFWKTNLREDAAGAVVYVGTASFDVGLKWGITHRIEPAIDTERDLLLADLERTGVVAHERTISFVPPTLGKNFFGDPFFTDGMLAVIRVVPY